MLKPYLGRRGRQHAQAGVSLIELMIAGVVMVVGFMGVMMLVTTAIASNNRNKMDSTGAMLTQAIMEKVSATAVGSGSTTLSDCAGNAFTIYAAAGGSTVLNGIIDFSQASPPQYYHMDYVVCSGNTQATYDVRWNVSSVSGTVYVVTVGARLKGAGTSLKYFALPVNMRTFAAQ